MFDLLRSHAVRVVNCICLPPPLTHTHSRSLTNIHLAHFMDLEHTVAQRQFRNQLSSGIWLPQNSDKRSLAHTQLDQIHMRRRDLSRKVYWK